MALDPTRFTDIRPAPRAVFDGLDGRRHLTRFFVSDGTRTGWRAITWGTYADEIRAAAACLRERGIGPGDAVAIFAPNRFEWACAALAIQSVGAVMIPIYPASTTEQAAYILDHGDVKLVFADTPVIVDRCKAAVASLKRPCPVVDISEDWDGLRHAGRARLAMKPGEIDEILATLDLDDVGLMLYTSGTSGAPKGVPLTHRNVGCNAVDWLVNNGPLLADTGAGEKPDVDILWLPMSHIFGFGELCLGNTLGFVSYLADPASVLGLLPEVQPTIFMSVPAYWEKLASRAAASGGDDAAQDRALTVATGGRLKFCLSGGAGLKREVKERFYRAGMLIIEGYGLTECAPTLTLNRPGAFRFDSVGLPLPSVELKLAEDGEILARGPNIFSGYHKNPAATTECFTADGWFMTGDVGRFTEDGFLQIVDRKKDILVTAGGKNVPPANIELRFADEPLVDHVVVYGDGKSYLVAGVWVNAQAAAELAEGTDLGEAVTDAIGRVNDSLARYETIKKWHIMDEPLTVEAGLLTASLKIRRKAIYQQFGEVFEALYADTGRSTAP